MLLDSVPAFSDGQADWELAHPYLRTYLAQHAHAAGPDTFAGLVADLDYLAVAEPAILTPILTPTDPALRWAARPYRRARPVVGQNARDNAAYLQEATVAETGSHPTSQRIRPTYQTLIARVLRNDSLLTLAGHTLAVWSVAFGTGADGRPLLASGSDDGMVRLWDPATGDPVGDPLHHPGSVGSVAFGASADGRPLLASAKAVGRNVWVWDPATGDPLGDPLHHTDLVMSMAFGVGAYGRPLLALGSHDQTVRLWDPATGDKVGRPLHHTNAVSAVAFGIDADSRPLLASGQVDGTVRLWDPATGDPVGDPLHQSGWVDTVAFGTGASGRPLLAAA